MKEVGGRAPRLIGIAAVLLFAAVSARVAVCADKTSVWKVSSEKGTVYLVGSIHMLAAKDLPLPSAMDEAVDDAQVVVFEVDPDSLQTSAIQTYVLQNAMFPEGKTLKTELGDSAYALAEAKAESLGVDLGPFAGFRPWFAALTLTVTEMQKMGFDPTLGVEMELAKKAKEEGKTIGALETAKYQLGLFIDLTDEQQRDFLLQTLSQLSDIQRELARIVAAWKTGSLTELDEELNKSFDEYPEIYERLVTQRNRSWVEEIGAFLESGRIHTLVVGVGHMPGRDGLLELLAKKGYTIEQM